MGRGAEIPSHATMMNYVEASSAPLRKTGQIKLHGPEAFEGMRKAGRLVAECLDLLAPEIKPGVPTDRLDRLVFEFAMDHGARPATLMYRGYTKSTCTSINHVVCHGIPNDKPLKDADIVNVDVTLVLDGWHGDSSRMYAVGEIPRRAERLIEVTYEAMMRGISVIRPGAALECVVSVATDERVVAETARQSIVATEPADDVGTGRATQPVGSLRADDRATLIDRCSRGATPPPGIWT